MPPRETSVRCRGEGAQPIFNPEPDGRRIRLSRATAGAFEKLSASPLQQEREYD